jgi:hypothetical protein
VSQERLYKNPGKTAIDKAASLAVSCITKRNGTGTVLVDWHKTDTACSCDVLANENPGALAGATGADTDRKAGKLWPNPNPFIAASHPIISLHWGIEA